MIGNESMTDIAYSVLKKNKKPMAFYELWDKVVEEIAKTTAQDAEELISHFYTNMTIDGRFVNVGDNKWELRERVPYERVHIDMNEIYQEDEDEDEITDYDLEDEDEIDDMYLSDDEDEVKVQKYDDLSSLITSSKEEEE